MRVLNPTALALWIFGGSFGTLVGCVIDVIINGDTSLPLTFAAAGVALASGWSLTQPS